MIKAAAIKAIEKIPGADGIYITSYIVKTSGIPGFKTIEAKVKGKAMKLINLGMVKEDRMLDILKATNKNNCCGNSQNINETITTNSVDNIYNENTPNKNTPDFFSLDFSLSLGTVSGSGVGLAINILERFRIKVASFILFDTRKVGLSSSFAFYKFNTSSLYISGGVNLDINEIYDTVITTKVISGILGWRKYFINNIFMDFEVGVGKREMSFEDYSKNDFVFTNGVSLGYKF